MLPVDQKIFGITLRQMCGARGVGIAVKVGSIKRYRLIKRLVLLPRRSAEYGIQPTSDADFGKGPKRRLFFPVKLPDCLDETQSVFRRKFLCLAPNPRDHLIGLE